MYLVLLRFKVQLQFAEENGASENNVIIFTEINYAHFQ